MTACNIPDQMQYVSEAAMRKGFQFEFLDHYSFQIARVTHNSRHCLLGTGAVSVYPINSATAVSIVRDKAHTHTILKQAGYKTPAGEYFFLSSELRHLRGAGRERSDALEYAERIGYPVFVKPNSGARGMLTDIVYSSEQLGGHLDKIAEQHYMALIQEVATGAEYRLFVLDGEPVFGYRRHRVGIVGDGASEIHALLPGESERIMWPGYAPSESSFFRELLRSRGYALNTVLPKNEFLPYFPARSPNLGGRVTDYSEEFPAAVRDWARGLAALFNIRVCGFDFFCDSLDGDPASFTILEINGNPSLRTPYRLQHQETVYRVWGEILDEAFKDQTRAGPLRIVADS